MNTSVFMGLPVKHQTGGVSTAALSAAKEHIDAPQRCWRKSPWTVEAETELFGRTRSATSAVKG